MIFARNFIGGPLANSGPWMVDRNTRVIVAVLGPKVVGRYVLSNLGWVWHQ